MQIASSASVEVRRAAVGLAEDGDGFDAEVVAGADDPQGDLTAVGDQDALEHGHSGPAGRLRTAADRTRRLGVFDQHFRDDAGALGVNLVEDLHRFDVADDRVGRDSRADFDEGTALGLGLA